MQTPTIRDRLVALADNPQGATAADFCAAVERGPGPIGSHVSFLESRQRLFRARRAGCRLRFFANAPARDAWLAKIPVGKSFNTVMPGKVRQQGPVLVDVHQRIKSRAQQPRLAPLPLAGSERNRQPSGAPVTVDCAQFRRIGDLVMTEKTKLTICPSSTHDPRYQIAPGAAVDRLFSAMPPGHYLGEPSAWAVAAMQPARGLG